MKTTATIAAILALTLAGAAQARPAAQPFTNPSAAAKRLTVAARVHDGVRLFHACAPVNPYLIRCGGYIAGLKPLTKSGLMRVRIDWRKVNPYMLEKTVYALGGVFSHALVDTTIAY